MAYDVGESVLGAIDREMQSLIQRLVQLAPGATGERAEIVSRLGHLQRERVRLTEPSIYRNFRARLRA